MTINTSTEISLNTVLPSSRSQVQGQVQCVNEIFSRFYSATNISMKEHFHLFYLLMIDDRRAM